MIDSTVLAKIEFIIEYCLTYHLPFFAYRLPNSNVIEIGIQSDLNVLKFDDLTDLKEKDGFVLAPFEISSKYPQWFLRKDLSFCSDSIDEKELLKLESCKNELLYSKIDDRFESSEQDYFIQISKYLEALNGDDLQKAILSRILIEKSDVIIQKSALFVQICTHYPQAFVSFVSLPEQCSWMGASPELLLKSQDNTIETVALAGTLALSNSDFNSINWGQKEIDEQAFVSNYIETIFEENQIHDFKKDGPYTVQAGQVVHLKTDYKINKPLSFQNKAKMISALHPTPAVCGLPKKEALDLINKLETHDREYYAGYWGPLHANGDLALYVNLRTMKITENQLSLFVGGGITADSVPQKEWEETNHKAQTLLSVIKAGNLS